MRCRWTEREVDDAIWEEVKNLLPPPRPRRTKYTGRLPQDPRSALGGILFVLRHNLAWNKLPVALGFGCGSACRKRLVEWRAAGVLTRLHAVLLSRLHAADRIDWSRAAADASSLRALKRGPHGSQPDRPRPCRQQTPLADRRPGHPAGGLAGGAGTRQSSLVN